MAKFFEHSFRSLIAAMTLTLFTGCIVTRSDVKELEQKKVVQDQVVNLQKANADQASKFSEINTDLRELNGRIDVVENKIVQIHSLLKERQGGDAQKSQELERKVSALQEEIVKLEGQVVVMAQELQSLKAAPAPSDAKSAFESAEDLFEKKEWKKAILAYQKFRDSNPKHRKFPKATLRIGLAFNELGMKDEARTFFEEVVAKYPQSEEAKQAKSKLKKK